MFESRCNTKHLETSKSYVTNLTNKNNSTVWRGDHATCNVEFATAVVEWGTLFLLCRRLWVPPWAFAEIFLGGATSTFRLSFSGCERCNANGPSKNAFYPFYTTKNIPHERTRSVRIFWNRIEVELYPSLQKSCTFCHPSQLLLNWAIIQYHHYCELQTIESELVLNYSQLRLRCSH